MNFYFDNLSNVKKEWLVFLTFWQLLVLIYCIQTVICLLDSRYLYSRIAFDSFYHTVSIQSFVSHFAQINNVSFRKKVIYFITFHSFNKKTSAPAIFWGKYFYHITSVLLVEIFINFKWNSFYTLLVLLLLIWFYIVIYLDITKYFPINLQLYR